MDTCCFVTNNNRNVSRPAGPSLCHQAAKDGARRMASGHGQDYCWLDPVADEKATSTHDGWLAWEELRAVGDLVHVEKFFARNLGALPRHQIRATSVLAPVQLLPRPENPTVTVAMQRMLQAAENKNTARGSPRSMNIP